ncbi:LysR family transcriptional regulator [Aliihoeflea aestuarii]|jgi:DNA-binding transcriptional LysR family regulator|uniref:LysR family transcriptional regulator n=1 Tax=Aliihoeflea aestuarii TaxID=453840 RepID=UPI002094E6A9|nr:LysR family transcriptional regulator [Aliihoeflea aestuarii]MCO6392573.1 LysR family transcriptional regulator [Aliihoeflea aestuarii]
MNLRSLRIFRRVVTTGSLAQASQDLNISPSAASRLLTILEAELKLRLFSRSKRRLELTEEGDRFYRQTEHILRGLDEMDLVASDIRSRADELLSLVTAAPLAMGLISPTLALMQERNETFECVLNVETRFDLESKVAARAYNIGIISLPLENAILDLAVEPFMETRLGVLLRTDHPLAKRPQISVEDLRDQPMITLTKGQRWRDRLESLFTDAGAIPKIGVETTSTPVAKALVGDRAGVMIADKICGRVHEGEPLVLKPLVQEIWITYATLHPKGPRSRRSAIFVEAMRNYLQGEMKRDPDSSKMLRMI